MPYQSLKQEHFFHSPGAAKVGITPQVVQEFDNASRGMRFGHPQAVKSALHAERIKRIIHAAVSGMRKFQFTPSHGQAVNNPAQTTPHVKFRRP